MDHHEMFKRLTEESSIAAHCVIPANHTRGEYIRELFARAKLHVDVVFDDIAGGISVYRIYVRDNSTMCGYVYSRKDVLKNELLYFNLCYDKTLGKKILKYCEDLYEKKD